MALETRHNNLENKHDKDYKTIITLLIAIVAEVPLMVVI